MAPGHEHAIPEILQRAGLPPRDVPDGTVAGSADGGDGDRLTGAARRRPTAAGRARSGDPSSGAGGRRAD
jgi:hypothetical protein